MTTFISAPLNKLTAWQGNVRKTGATEGIDELAASIATHGLLQPLVVRKEKRGKYAVIAGGRRLAALRLLADQQRIDADYDVPCTLSQGKGDDREISLAENVIRAPMHPADQFDAFRDIIDGGASTTDVAARFGLAESTVAKRLKLGRLSPVIMTAYREDQIDLAQAEAFALSDDQEAQQRVFAEIAGRHISPRAIRQALTQGEIPATDKRARFIGLEAYEQAGGTIRRDLFDGDNAGYLQNPTLLDQLVADKLRGFEPEIKAEGWAWTQVLPEADLSPFNRLYPETGDLSDELAAELAALEAEHDSLEYGDDDAENDAIADRLDAIENRIEEIDERRPQSWTPEQLALAGVIITLRYDGTPDIRRGLVRPEDQRAAKAVSRTNAQAKPKPAFPASLVQELTAQRTAALSAELMQRPDIALAAIVHAFAGRTFYGSHDSCLGVTASPSYPAASIPKTDHDAKALAAIESARERWGDHLPGDRADLWQWCLDQDRDVLLDLLAFCAARTVDATIRKNERNSLTRPAHADPLASALSLNMAAWFTPTAANYFTRVSRDQIAQAYREAKGHDLAPAWLKLKKGELAQRVAEAVAGTGWLPAPLRPAVSEPAGIDNAPQDDDKVAMTTAQAAE